MKFEFISASEDSLPCLVDLVLWSLRPAEISVLDLVWSTPITTSSVCLLAGQQEVSSPRPASTTADPTPPSLAAVLVSLNQAGNEIGSVSTASGWRSRPGCSADPNTEPTSGTTRGAAPPGTRCRTVENHQRGGFIPVCLWKSTTRPDEGHK